MSEQVNVNGEEVMVSKYDGECSAIKVPPQTIAMCVGGEQIIKMEPGGFWYKDQKIDDVGKVYEAFIEFIRRSGSLL